LQEKVDSKIETYSCPFASRRTGVEAPPQRAGLKNAFLETRAAETSVQFDGTCAKQAPNSRSSSENPAGPAQNIVAPPKGIIGK